VVAYLRRLDPHLPRQVWLVQAGGVVNSLGNGIVLPFVVIYLHNVRGISFAEAGLALAFGGAAALASGWAAGSIVDRIGGRNTLLLGLLLQAVAFALSRSRSGRLLRAVCVLSAGGCLLLERRLPERVRRTPKPDAVSVTPFTPPLDLAPERL
jgi:predicted MFS family arabinose efflux permease